MTSRTALLTWTPLLPVRGTTIDKVLIVGAAIPCRSAPAVIPYAVSKSYSVLQSLGDYPTTVLADTSRYSCRNGSSTDLYIIWDIVTGLSGLQMIPLGRPITFRSKEYLTLRPDVIEPCPPGALGPTSFRYQRWSGDNDRHHGFAYPVRSLEERSCRDLLEPLEVLHDERAHDAAYTGAPYRVLRGGAVAASGISTEVEPQHPGAEESNISADTLLLKSFDLCQSAASHASSIVTVYDEKYGLDRSPPFLSIYLQGAGGQRLSNTQATIGLMQCITALRTYGTIVQTVCPGATSVRSLLARAKVELNQTSKAVAESLQDRSAQCTTHSALNAAQTCSSARHSAGPSSAAADPDAHLRVLAHSLGLSVPGVEASTSFYPGYRWWPRPEMSTGAMQEMPPQSDPSGTAMYVGGSA
ncbi:hypothetical protein BKA93DRAFT_753959 [Sparassis latifolia]